MNTVRRNRLSVFLMTGSLLLLLLFLCFWLKNVYDDTYEELQKDTNYLFSESIRTIEDEMMDSLYGSPFSFTASDTTNFSTIKIRLDHRIDTLHTMALVSQEMSQVPKDSAFRFSFRSKKTSGKEKDMFGTLALVAAIGSDSLRLDSLLNSKGDSGILGTLENQVAKGFLEADIPLAYQIIHLEEGQNNTGKFISSSYTDVINSQSYAIVYDHYQLYLFRNMLPEILFSLFLFSCITIAFFVVHQSLRQQSKLAQLKNDFVSNITHELKTPIATVGVAIEALSDFEVLKNPERTKEYLDISKHELNRLSILVDKVLKMSLFEKREPELTLEPLNMNQLIQGILETMALQFEKLHAVVHFKPSEQEAKLTGDKIHLTNVLYNLIDNALKYSGGLPEISISLEESLHQIKLNIADKGMGIPLEYKDKIFEKFFRIPTGDKHNIKGYGLGLSYVKSVVKKHHGSIEVQSTPGLGTSFTLVMPK